MTRRGGAALAALLLGCSTIAEEGGGVIALEITAPVSPTVEVGDTVTFAVRALDRNGDSVPASLTWRTPDTTLAVDGPTGRITGRVGGTTGRVQAILGSLVSNLITVSVLARADTLILVGQDTLRVAQGVTVSGPLSIRLESANPAGPLSGRPVIFEVVSPVFADPSARTVELTGGVLLDTITTGAGGTPASPVTLGRVAGVGSPDSALVEVRAFRARGTVPVPGSGQRFTVRFTNP